MSAARKRKKSLRESLVVELVDCIANPQEKAKRKKQNNDVAERAGGQPEAELSTKRFVAKLRRGAFFPRADRESGSVHVIVEKYPKSLWRCSITRVRMRHTKGL